VGPCASRHDEFWFGVMRQNPKDKPVFATSKR
jgi:hypothetical protein